MAKNFVEELKWRGMLAQIMPGTEEYLQSNMVSAYLGTDPTADSLHIGHLCGIMMLRHLQRCGHQDSLPQPRGYQEASGEVSRLRWQRT